MSFLSDLEQYSTTFPEEKTFKARFLQLLLSPEAFDRTHLPGHITGSAFIVSPDRTKTLLVHHAKLNRWLQPGGHADGDQDVLHVAMREANEETGLKDFKVIGGSIFDLDIHPIPARKDFPAHDHYDVRYLLEASTEEPILVSEESHDVKWINLDQLEIFNNERALIRLREKLQG